jgi:sulfate adenylyltransferase subunit 1
MKKIKKEMQLNGNNTKGLLRFTTAGSVDDGKSTLIGRLLYDSKSIFEDQMQHIALSSRRLGKDGIDLSLLTDGLRAEREQGITIDVAYRYFATPRRKFIIADTPGHIQYTRNMVTGASTADLAVILIDARRGVLEQTLRHAYIASLLRIEHVIFCINKMDLVAWSEEVFRNIMTDLVKLSQKLDIHDVHFIPVSAKNGDNVVDPSTTMNWYKGKTFLRLIETIDITRDTLASPFRFPVQTILRPQSEKYPDYRGYAGRVAGGKICQGDEVTVLPSMIKSRIKRIDIYGESLPEACMGDSVTLTLEDQIDVGRGNLIARPGELPRISQELHMMVCWFNDQPLKPGKKYILRNYSNEVSCLIKSVNYKMNINNLERNTEEQEVYMNDIAHLTVKTSKPLFYDPYRENNITGSIIFVDENSNETVAAGMISS